METVTKTKNPVRDYRKAVVAVLAKYFAIEAAAIRFSSKAIRAHRAAGESPAYVALTIGRAWKLPIAPAFQKKRGR